MPGDFGHYHSGLYWPTFLGTRRGIGLTTVGIYSPSFYLSPSFKTQTTGLSKLTTSTQSSDQCGLTASREIISGGMRVNSWLCRLLSILGNFWKNSVGLWIVPKSSTS